MRQICSTFLRIATPLVACVVACQPTGWVGATAQWQVIYPQRTMPFFHQGTGIGVDGQHNVYVLDQLEAREYKLSATGKRLGMWPAGQPTLRNQWYPTHL